MQKKKRTVKPLKFSTKGELVADQNERELTAEETVLKDNPYKTPPANITNKDREYDHEKG